MSAYKFRRFLIATHRYVGLTVGLLIVVVGLSGSVAVVWNEMTQLVDPRFRIAEPGVERAPLQKVLENLHAAHPNRKDTWSVDYPYPDDRHAPAWAVYENPEERAGFHESPLYVGVNPYTGEIIGQFYWGTTTASWIYNLHSYLQLDEPGEKVVGVIGIALLLLAASGLYLWWPIGRFTRQQFTMIPGAKGPRFEFHLHKLLGFYSSLVLLVISLTGIIIVWPSESVRAIGAVQPVNVPTIEEFKPPKARVTTGAQLIPFDAALEKALQMFPGSEFRHAIMPSPGSDEAYGVVLRQPHERYTRKYPETRVWVDPYSGEVLEVMDARQFNLSRSIVGYNRYTFHDGSAFGTIGSTVVFCAGLLPAFFFYTGFRQWLRARRRSGQSATAVEETAR